VHGKTSRRVTTVSPKSNQYISGRQLLLAPAFVRPRALILLVDVVSVGVLGRSKGFAVAVLLVGNYKAFGCEWCCKRRKRTWVRKAGEEVRERVRMRTL
jgi:hypothetical protein